MPKTFLILLKKINWFPSFFIIIEHFEIVESIYFDLFLVIANEHTQSSVLYVHRTEQWLVS